jgi:diketogulonate reductase-like aldo/keto reductase
MRTVHLPDGTAVAAIGQGTWHMGEGGCPVEQEVRALRQGIDLGMTLIDTAEMYGDGASERIVGDAIAGQRERVFVVSKVFPHNASHRAMPRACEASLKRLRIECIDLYLLHWRGGIPLTETVDAFERLRAAGKIARWGVSNFDVDDMEELGDGPVATNQVLYNPGVRGIEFDLIPWCADRHIPVMAYSPVGQGGTLLRNPALAEVAARHAATPAQIALAWTIRLPGIITIPKASDPAHVAANAAAAAIELTPGDLAAIDATFPPPRRRQRLEML